MISICVDREKCRKDKLCMIECPARIIKKDKNGYPELRADSEGQCIKCGHCVAICPHDALTLEADLSKKYDHINPELKISKETVKQLVKGRRSVRQYKEQPLSKEEVNELLDMVRWAPTATNSQPVNWVVVENRKATFKVAKMVADWMDEGGVLPGLLEVWNSGYDCILRGAPNLLIAHASEKGFVPTVDCTIAATTLELGASAMGIGSCWAGIFMMAANNYLPLIEYLKIPDGHKVCAALMMGHPKFDYHRIPARNEAKVSWIK